MTLVQRLALVTGATVCVGGGRRRRQRPRDAPVASASGSRRSPSRTAPYFRSAIEPGASMVQTETAETDDDQQSAAASSWLPLRGQCSHARRSVQTPASGAIRSQTESRWEISDNVAAVHQMQPSAGLERPWLGLSGRGSVTRPARLSFDHRCSIPGRRCRESRVRSARASDGEPRRRSLAAGKQGASCRRGDSDYSD